MGAQNLILPQQQPAKENSMKAISNFLMRKELLLSRFTNFNDQPESYRAWKMNFKSVINELSIGAFEEMQLLIRFLGPESSQNAADIRQGNADSPDEGVKLIWNRLEDRYGKVEYLNSSLREKIENFPSLSLNDPKKLYKLLDLLTQIDSMKRNPLYAAAFSYYPIGIYDIVNKLPYQWREKWIAQAADYKLRTYVVHPPFTFFVQFIQDLCRVRNDPGFQFKDDRKDRKIKDINPVRSKKTEIKHTVSLKEHKDTSKAPTQRTPLKTSVTINRRCPVEHIYGSTHNVTDCKKFRSLEIADRKNILKDNNLCYRYCGEHLARDCTETVKCQVCSSTDHTTALHPETATWQGGEQTSQVNSPVVHRCTTVCGNQFGGKSCAKIILAQVYPSGQPRNKIRAYVILDDQSSQTLAKSSLFDTFDVDSEYITYSLSSCSGLVTVHGRRVTNFVVEPVGKGSPAHLSAIIEYDNIPSCREEIPTPDVIKSFPHLSDLSSEILDIDKKAEILIIIGRDHPDARHVLDQRLGPHGTPFAQRFPLGWTVIGECCLGKVHKPKSVIANKTEVLNSGQSTTFTPCPNYMRVIECQTDIDRLQDDITKDFRIFERTKDDNLPGLSIEDRDFLSIMDSECHKGEDGHWVAPLPFRVNRARLHNVCEK